MTSSWQVARSHRGMSSGIEDALKLAESPPHCAARNEAVSSWSVQQHLEHLLLTDGAIADGIAQGLAAQPAAIEGGTPSRWGRIVLWSGRIPRGRGRAPDFVIPHEMPAEKIRAGFKDLRLRFTDFGEQLADIRCLRGTIAHPLLGDFTAAQWLRFGHIHHRHHDRIIRDIQQATSQQA